MIDEGFLVLSAKVRNHAKTSLVTKQILEKLVDYKGQQNVVWTFEMRRMTVLAAKAMEFDEPILLVGPTGCGKTTICQILSEIAGKSLRILKCDIVHTEGADFLGVLRPYRGDSEEQKRLFEWSDGPLILSMVEGNYFMADEIFLAEDSVLERLNCVLESGRTVLLAEKGGVDADITQGNSEFIIFRLQTLLWKCLLKIMMMFWQLRTQLKKGLELNYNVCDFRPILKHQS